MQYILIPCKRKGEIFVSELKNALVYLVRFRVTDLSEMRLMRTTKIVYSSCKYTLYF